jgi:hypothetical protein
MFIPSIGEIAHRPPKPSKERPGGTGRSCC